MGVGYKHRDWTEKDIEEIVERWLNGESYSQIAKDFNVSQWTIGRKLRERLRRG